MSSQSPINSGFGPSTTAAEVVQSSVRRGAQIPGMTVVITGGYSGLGLEMTRVLSAAGARVIVPARDRTKATAALAGLSSVELEHLDLARADSIATFAERMLGAGRVIDVLVDNAGIMAVPLSRDARGFESHFAVNYLGHADLTRRLWPALASSGRARVVSVTSRAYRFSPVDLLDTHFRHREYEKWAAYGQSMSAKAMLAVDLDQRGADQGIRSFAVHPGTILTDLSRHLSRAELIGMGAVDDRGVAVDGPGYKTAAQGAATAVWAAISPQLDGLGGLYLDDVDVAPLVDSGSDLYGPGVDRWLVDQDQARRLGEFTDTLLSPQSVSL